MTRAELEQTITRHIQTCVDAIYTDVAAWCAGQVRAAVTPQPGERRGEPRVTSPTHYWVGSSPLVGHPACGVLRGNCDGRAEFVTCQGCMHTTAYKTALAGGDT